MVGEKVKVDPEFAAMIPSLQTSELTGLEESLKAEGCRDPLCLWRGLLLDGHNRLAICNRLDIPFKTTSVDLPSRDAAKLWIIRNQFSRRNLTDAQRVDLALKAEGLIAARAKANQIRKPSSVLATLPEQTIETREELAELSGVGARTIDKQRFVRDNSPETYQKLIAPGSDLSINRAYLDVSQPIRREEKLKAIEANGHKQKAPEATRPASIVLADPPWRYADQVTEARAIENKYPTLTTEEIRDLAGHVAERITDDCLLFLWATMPKLAEAIGVMESWGFTYTSGAVWDKEIIGQGYYFRQQCELLLIGKRGSIPTPLPADRPSSIFRFRRGEHSAKPEYVYELLDKWYPNLPKLELFARAPKVRPGWMYWGNEA